MSNRPCQWFYSLLVFVLIGCCVGVLWAENVAAEADTVATDAAVDPNEVGEKDAPVVDPNSVAEPASEVSRDSTDIEELLQESEQTLDQEVIEEARQEKEVKEQEKAAAKEEKEAAIVEAVEPVEEPAGKPSKEPVEKPVEEAAKEKPKEVIPPKDIPVVVPDSNDLAPGIADSNDVAVAQDVKDVEEVLKEEAKPPLRQRFEDTYIHKMLVPYADFKQYLGETHQISVATEHVFMYQRATGGRDPHDQSLYNFSLLGVWNLSRPDQPDRGVVGFSFEQRDNITEHNVATFSEAVGGNYRTNGLNSNERSRTALRQLWWRKRFDDNRLTLTVGKINHGSYYNRNAYAGSTKTHFLSQPFSRNPNRLNPADGLGANVNIKPTDQYYLSLGFGDARANTKTSGFDTIEDGDFVTMAEFGLTPPNGNYRFTAWHTDETVIDDVVSKEGYGLGFSFDHEIDKKYGVFGRYGYAEPQVSNMQHFVSGGFVIQDAWGIAGDLFGVGLAWDQRSDTSADEISMEVFHRMQATKMLQLTPSILVIFNPSQAEPGQTEPVAVFGFRARVLF